MEKIKRLQAIAIDLKAGCYASMHPPALRTRLMWGVAILIVGCGLTVAIAVAALYHHHLQTSVSQQGEFQAGTIVQAVNQNVGSYDLKDFGNMIHDEIWMSAKQKSWFQAGLTACLVIVLAVCLALYLIRKMTHPLCVLSREAEETAEGRIVLDGPRYKYAELNRLASAFSSVIERDKACALDLDARTAELERAQRRGLIALEIIRTVGSCTTLQGVCAHIVDKLKEVIPCRHLAMAIIGSDRKLLFLHRHTRLKVIPGDQFHAVWELITQIKGLTFKNGESISIPMLDPHFRSVRRIGFFPLRFENQPLGAMLVGCPKGCHCSSHGLEVTASILMECAGAVKRAVHHAEDQQSMHCRIKRHSQFCGIVGKDRRMQSLFKLVEDIAPTDAAVLVQGESGTGKELVAMAIHERSLRKDKPFVVINCSAFPTSLLESELFGHEKGAYTGAIRKKIGRFEQADGGTVFLDEIGEIAPSAQIKLLRVLQTHSFERIGGEQTLEVDVRVIAATNRNLIDEIRNGRFREDLYYRLNVILIHLPPLRERINDIPLLARHFLSHFNKEQGKQVKDFRTAAMSQLLDYTWPGNVRELENTIEHALVLTKGDHIEMAALPSNLRAMHKTGDASSHATRRNSVTEHEKRLYQETLEQAGWNKKLAAKRLGISRSTLYNKIKKYRLVPPTIH